MEISNNLILGFYFSYERKGTFSEISKKTLDKKNSPVIIELKIKNETLNIALF
jgi:hypothetical protein